MAAPAGAGPVGDSQDARSRDRSAALGWFLVVSFLANFGQGVYPPLLPEVVGALGLSLAAAGFLGTIFSLPRAVLSLPAGRLVDPIGPIPVMHAGLGLVLTGTLLATVAGSLATMAVARAMVGLGYGITALVGIVYLMQAGPPTQRTRRGNMYEGALISANAVSGYLAGTVSVHAGWRWGFGAAAGAVGVAWVLATWRVFPAIRAVFHGRPAPGVAPGVSPPVPRPAPLALIAIHLVVFALAFAWAGAIVTLAPLYGSQGLGLDSAAIGRTLAIGYLIEAILLIPVGWAADTFGRLRVLVPGLAVLVAGVTFLPLTRGLAGYTVACTLVIVGMTVWMIPASLLVEHLHGRFGSRTVGLYRFVTDLGTVAAPLLVGWLTGRAGFRVGAAAIVLVLIASGTIAGLVLGPRHRRAAPNVR